MRDAVGEIKLREERKWRRKMAPAVCLHITSAFTRGWRRSQKVRHTTSCVRMPPCALVFILQWQFGTLMLHQACSLWTECPWTDKSSAAFSLRPVRHQVLLNTLNDLYVDNSFRCVRVHVCPQDLSSMQMGNDEGYHSIGQKYNNILHRTPSYQRNLLNSTLIKLSMCSSVSCCSRILHRINMKS